MKFQSPIAFEKHLKEAYPDHLSHVYMVITSFDFERKKFIETIASVMRRKEKMAELLAFDASTSPIEAILGQLNSYSLFGGSSVVIVDRIEKLKKASCDALAQYLVAPSPTVFLILGGSSLKGLSDLCQKGKKELVILDLSEEKAWNRKTRLRQWLMREAGRAQKSLSASLVDFLLEEVGTDMQNLHQELDKLICFTGEKREIELKDAMAVCVPSKTETSWQLAENLVWGSSNAAKNREVHDIAFLLPLIGQIRYQLQLGLQIVCLMQEDRSLPEITQFLSNGKMRNLDKNAAIARKRGDRFFKEGLNYLFDLELSLKNGAHSPGLMWDLFTSKLLTLQANK